MTVLRTVAKRVALGLVTAWAVLTGVFALFTLSRDWVLEGQQGLIRLAHRDGEEADEAVEEATDAYLAARGLDQPIHELYLDYLTDMLVLDWGESLATGEPVFPMVTGAAVRTLAYVVPSLVVAVVVGMGIGLLAAMRPESRLANGGVLTAYALFAVPAFWLGGMAYSLVWGPEPAMAYSPLLFEHALPVLLTTFALVGGYVSYARAHSLEYVSADFVKLVRAKGASSRAVATHVLRNAAIPLFSMLFTEALALLVLAVFVVELLFGIEGFGLVLFEAVAERDLPVIMGSILLVIVAGVVGNVVQDLSYSYLDPRVDTGRR